jgi:hypothetical protein
MTIRIPIFLSLSEDVVDGSITSARTLLCTYEIGQFIYAQPLWNAIAVQTPVPNKGTTMDENMHPLPAPPPSEGEGWGVVLFVC